MRPWERLEDIVEVITSDVVLEFFSRFLESKRKCLTLWIISPWITPLKGEPVTLRQVANRLESEKVYTRVITRLPDQPHYEDAVRTLADVSSCEILIMNELHAKLYVAYNQGESFAMIGSANVSAHSRRAVEVGLLVKDYKWGTDLIQELINAAHFIRSQPHIRVKSIGKPFNDRIYGDLLSEFL